MTLRNNGARRTTRTVVRVLIASTEAFRAADAGDGYSLNYADTRVGRDPGEPAGESHKISIQWRIQLRGRIDRAVTARNT